MTGQPSDPNPVTNRTRNGLNLSFYILQRGQDFINARSIPRGTHGHRERPASSVVRTAFSVYQWLVMEHAKAFAKWSDQDWLILLRCLPGEPLIATDDPKTLDRVFSIPSIVEQETKRLGLERVLAITPQSIQGFLRRLRNLTPYELIALSDHLERLRVQSHKDA